MLSQTVEYALRAVVVLAKSQGSSRTVAEVAAQTGVPPEYLSKIMGGMVRTGLVQAQRGRGGGFLLARAPEELSVLDVVSAVDPIRRIRRCPLGLAEHRSQLCSLHRTIDEAMDTMERALAAATIASLLGEAPENSPLCDSQGRSLAVIR